MSNSVARPIIRQIKDSEEALDFFESVLLPEEDEKTQDIIRNFPTVYIHNWKEVEIVIPDYKEKRKWLNKYGEDIMQRI